MSDESEVAKLRAEVRSNAAAFLKSTVELYASRMAIEAAVFALLETHPQPERFLPILDERLEQSMAILLGQSLSEDAVDHFQAMSKRITDSARIGMQQTVLRRGGSPPG